MPELPGDNLVAWFYNRQAESSSSKVNDKDRLTVIGQHLRIAEKLLDEKDPTLRARGLLVASETANFVAAHLPKEKWLLARIYQGFLLPSIALAHVESWQSPSRQNLIQNASYAFAGADESELQIKMLQWLLTLGEKEGTGQTALQIDTNTLDWARGTFAALLVRSPKAPLSDLERAEQLLKSIQSPDMKGFSRLQTQVQKRIAQLKRPAV